MLAHTQAEAVELSALRSVELPRLLNAISSRLKELQGRYRYIAFHAPTDFQDERGLVEQLKGIAERRINIVVHPDTIRDVTLWRQLGDRLCIENMDSRKATGRTAKELRWFFERLPQAKLCFDVAHARQVDPTMTEAVRILMEFGDRMAQVHLSEVNSRGRHFAMSFIAKRAYEPLADILSNVPVILESMVQEAGIESEIEEARKVLTNVHPATQLAL
jgi:cytosine/adenosine deaminase-related metal-dependent hydrolase